MVHLLDLPLEIRLEIYSYLLITQDYTKIRPLLGGPRLSAGTGLLTACRQINAEATPVLYGSNLFLADPRRLTAQARLRIWGRPFSLPERLALVRRWWLAVPLGLDAHVPHASLRTHQCDRWYGAEEVRRAFTGIDELVLELLYGSYPQRVDALRPFESVRGIKTVRVVGCPAEFERYIDWLKRAMMSPEGSVVSPYREDAGAEGHINCT